MVMSPTAQLSEYSISQNKLTSLSEPTGYLHGPQQREQMHHYQQEQQPPPQEQKPLPQTNYHLSQPQQSTSMNNNQTTYQLTHTTHDRPSASSSFNILSVLNPEPSPPSSLGPPPADHITRTLPSPRQQEPPTRTILPPPSAITQPQYYDPVRYGTNTLQGHGQSQSNSTSFTLLPPPFPLASYPTSPTQPYSSNSHNSSNTQSGYGYSYGYRSPGFNTQTPGSFNTTLAPISQI